MPSTLRMQSAVLPTTPVAKQMGCVCGRCTPARLSNGDGEFDRGARGGMAEAATCVQAMPIKDG